VVPGLLENPSLQLSLDLLVSPLLYRGLLVGEVVIFLPIPIDFWWIAGDKNFPTADILSKRHRLFLSTLPPGV